MKKRILALLIALCLIVGLVPAVSAAEIASGTCGENLTWVLTEDGTLTILGTGAMDDYMYASVDCAPWKNQRGAIKSVIIENGVTTIGNYAFDGCYNLVSVQLPDSVSLIGCGAFYYCSDLAHINLPESIEQIYGGAFENCDGLTSITIPSKVKSIDDAVFMDCANLTKVVLPEGLTDIGNYAFGFSGLTEINIPSTVTHIDGRAFNWTPWEDNLTGGYIIVGDHVLIGYYNDTPLRGAAVIPTGVKYIAPTAFGYDWMEDVYYGDVKEITSITLPNTVIEIGAYAFDYQQFETITIPSSVSLIDYGAFSECENLKTIYFDGDAPVISESVFYGDSLTAYYPVNNSTWSESNRMDYEGDVAWIGYHSFDDTPADSFYFAPVVWASTNNITNGLSATEFGPTATCNRAQVVTFLWRAAGCPEPETASHDFVDVQAGSFYEKPVLWAVENGITNGSDATHFNPNGVCNRAQVVTFLYRAFGSPDLENAANPFTDVPSGIFYERAVLWAVENGITNGVNATHFGPNSACNRAAVVTFLYRAYVD